MAMTSFQTPNNINQKVPNFTLPSTNGEISIDNDLLDSPIIIVFYPKDGSSVCSNQLAVYNEALPVFQRYGANLVAISVDDIQSHEKFAKALNLRFPLLSDNNPKGHVSKAFDVYNENSKRCERAIFVADKDGKLIWSQIYPISVNPGAEGILQALSELESN